MKIRHRLTGKSYKKRVADVNRIYDEHAHSGLSNREIWRRYIWPLYGISERTLYNMLNAPSRMNVPDVDRQGYLFPDIDDVDTSVSPFLPSSSDE